MKLCIHEDCKKQSIYNYEGETKALYCSNHRLDGMVNKISKLCIHNSCKSKTRATYNYEGKNPLYCSIHKLEGMINVNDKTCFHNDCKRLPSYNYEGQTKRLYCSFHKLEGMINVKTDKCIHKSCKKYPSFNFEGETKGTFCSVHKLVGMIDVKHKKCIYDNCKKIKNFNYDGETTALYCNKHKLEGMVDVINKTCIHEGCKTRPNYNYQGKTKALYCSSHKLEGMTNVVSKTCNSEWCLTIVKTNKYDGYCLFCYMNLFPDKPVSRNYKTKEYAVVEFVKNKFPEFDWITDKKINGGCSKRRPDLLLDLGYQVIIVEIDENQHTNYDCSCENKRLMELSQDVGHRPIVFIRFNPDDYIQDEVNKTSCWGINTKGICVVKKSKKEEWNNRLNALEEQVVYWSQPHHKTNKTIEIIELFYDC